MATITLEQLEARYERLTESRKQALDEFVKRDAGYAYVLGELELMMQELRDVADQEAHLAELERTQAGETETPPATPAEVTE